MTKHTLGPWVYDEVRTQCGRAFRIGSGEMLKAGKGCCIIYDDYPGNPENERKANARLIAAAPDMLETLKLIQDWDENDANPAGYGGLRQHLREAVDAAIAKAEGR